jgi:Xaa-Pro aminopeptidase
MKATRPGAWEYEVQAAIEHYSLEHGALHWGYPSIVASGPNATTLHYLSSTRQMKAGELLLVDAASSFQGLTGDITRTYPVSGRFSADERALYELVLQAQEAGLSSARPGASPDAITNAVRAAFAIGLPGLGLVDRSSSIPLEQQVALWFPHSPIHGIGVDVHDPLELLNPGAAFVIEPGLYIRTDALNPLRSQPGGPELIEALKPAVARFANMGIRIEDSFLMTPTGPEMLSSAAPRRVADIEKVVGTGR